MTTQSILILDNGWIERQETNYPLITIKLSDIDTVKFTSYNEIIITMKSQKIFFKRDSNKNEYFRIIKMWEEYLSRDCS